MHATLLCTSGQLRKHWAYSGHASRQSLEIYSRLAIGEAQEAYEAVIRRFPV